MQGKCGRCALKSRCDGWSHKATRGSDVASLRHSAMDPVYVLQNNLERVERPGAGGFSAWQVHKLSLAYFTMCCCDVPTDDKLGVHDIVVVSML